MLRKKPPGYMDDYKIKSFSIILPKTTWMYSLIEDEEFLKTYDNFSNKGSNSIKKH